MKTPDVPRIKVSTVPDCLDVIPPMLGFVPRESLVVMVVDDGMVALTARVDLAEVERPGSLFTLLTKVWSRFPQACATFVAYTDSAERGWTVLELCDDWLPDDRNRLLILAGDERWQCDSRHGPTGLRGVEGGRTAAEAVYHGMVTLPSREALAAGVDGPPDADLPELLAVTEAEADALTVLPANARTALMGDLIRGYDPDVGIDDATAARLALLAFDPDCRDVAILCLSRAEALRHQALWQQVVRRCVPSVQAYAVGILGLASWVRGDGALQCVCLERLDLLQPGSGLARMLSDLIEWVVPPQEWDRLRPQLSGAVSRHVRRAARDHARRQGVG